VIPRRADCAKLTCGHLAEGRTGSFGMNKAFPRCTGEKICCRDDQELWVGGAVSKSGGFAGHALTELH